MAAIRPRGSVAQAMTRWEEHTPIVRPGDTTAGNAGKPPDSDDESDAEYECMMPEDEELYEYDLDRDIIIIY